MKAQLKVEVSQEAFLHEQLALKRLRRSSSPKPVKSSSLNWPGWISLFLRPVELVREVAPGKPPLSREQWNPPQLEFWRNIMR
jgi:hypothetical protein